MQAYSCELYIDSFKVSHRGFVYFLWYTHSTQISSLRYESQGKTVPVKETLTVSVRVTFKNGKEQPLNVPILQSRPISSWWPKAEKSWTNSNYPSAILQLNLRTSNCLWIEVFVWLRPGGSRWTYLNNSSKHILEGWYFDPNLGKMTGSHLFQGSTNLSRRNSIE